MGWNPDIVDSEILAVHAAVVPGAGPLGEVVLFGGDEHWSAQAETQPGQLFKKTRVYDVATHALVAAQVPSPDSDVFCAHHAFTADGRLLIAGGTAKWPVGDDHHGHDLDFIGHNRCWLYNPRARTWTETARLLRNPDQPDEATSGGRWYPALVTLGSGAVMAFFGHPNQGDHRHRNTLPETYRGGGWTHGAQDMADSGHQPGAVRYLFYARVFQLPGGDLFFATPMPVEHATHPTNDGPYFSTRYDPATGAYTGPKIPEPGGYGDWSRPAVLLPLLPDEGYRPRVLFVGQPQPVQIDLDPSIAAPAWVDTVQRHASVRTRQRQYANAVLLPDGTVCVVGGVHVDKPEDPVLQAEIFRPGIDWATGTYSVPAAWDVKESGAHARNYHSTALLLPNGKVWVAGGNTNSDSGDPDGNVTVNGVTKKRGIKRIELYEPDYIAVPNRLRVQSAPAFVTYGDAIAVEVDRPASQVQRAALVRAGSVTHSTDNDQRYVGLVVTGRDGNQLTLEAPPDGNVAPPGYYLLWLIDAAGNPAEEGVFVRVGHVACEVVTDRSTFSQEEITALGGGGPVTVNHACYLNVDGYRNAELTATPQFSLAWADTGAAIDPADMTLIPAGRWVENPTTVDAAQRITFPFHVRFLDVAAMFGFTDTRQVRVTFEVDGRACQETFDLTHQPNPFMVDVDPARQNPHWLSTDTRVFKIRQGDTRFGDITHGAGAGAPNQFIRAVLDRFNALPNNSSHPFLGLTPELNEAQLDLATKDPDGTPVFNFAVAKVRYRATTTTAAQVRAFFRIFNVSTTGLAYDDQTIYRRSAGATPVPLLGTAGGEIASIPFFVEPRRETRQGRPTADAMSTQPVDPAREVRDIVPNAGGAEVTAYFGCWLDINSTTPRFPVAPAGDGPWPESSTLSIQQLMRGWHFCLVTEVFLAADPTNDGETPGTSDNLAQRNLAVLHAENPGAGGGRTVLHTFEVKPSEFFGTFPGRTVALAALHDDHGRKQRLRPDELLIRWGSLPRASEVEISFSDIDTADIAALAAFRHSPLAFDVVDRHTLRFRVADDVWVPIPGGRTLNIPALLTVRLPDGITYGDEYRFSVHQVSGGMRQRIIGAFEVRIPVSKAALMLPEAIRILSVMKYVGQSIPPDNRWYPIFLRYLAGLGDRVRGLGGDPDAVHGNPDGSGDRYVAPNDDGGDDGDGRCGKCWRCGSCCGALACLAGAAAVGAVVGAAVAALCRRCCRPRSRRRC